MVEKYEGQYYEKLQIKLIIIELKLTTIQQWNNTW